MKGILKNFEKFTGKHLAFNFTEKETLTQVFSYKICEIFKNTFYYRTPSVAAFVNWDCELQDIDKKTRTGGGLYPQSDVKDRMCLEKRKEEVWYSLTIVKS